MSTKQFGCVGNTIRLRSGIYFDLANPKPDQITIRDIAGALSKICRFGGQCDRFYSVAEHCYHCSMLATVVPLACLLHDSAEAFIGDVVKPLKIMLPEYRDIERRIEIVIARKYGVDFDQPEVSEIDRSMLIAERRAMFSADKVKWAGEDDVAPVIVGFGLWDPQIAETEFLRRAIELGITE